MKGIDGIKVSGSSFSVTIRFDENRYTVKEEDVMERIGALTMNGTIIGANLDYLDHGMIICYFNDAKPKVNAEKVEREINERLVGYIESCKAE